MPPEGASPSPAAVLAAAPPAGPPARRLHPVLAVFLGALALVLATAAVGRPSVFTDTDDYYAQGRSIVRAATQKVVAGKPIFDWAEVRERAAHPGSGDEEPVHNQDGARSAYYGLALYLLNELGSLWLVDGVQSLCAAALVYALLRAAAPAAGDRLYLLAMAALAGGSTLPWFTAFAMPDVFAGFSAVTMALLMIYPDRFGWLGQGALFAFLVAAMNVHTSNVLTAAGLLAVSLPVLALLRRPPGELVRRTATVLAAAALAVVLSKAYAVAVTLRSGDALGRPPFLTARVLADGPGRAYLRHACAHGRPYLVCDFKWLPLDDSEDILWSDDPLRGIFNWPDFHVREELTREDVRFALAAALFDPVGQAAASLANWGAQIVNTRLDEPLMGPGYYLRDGYWRTTRLPRLILKAAPGCARPGACAPRVDPEAVAVLDGVLALAAAGLVALRLSAGPLRAALRRPDFADPRLRGVLAAGLLLLALLVNALVCGAISGPFPRYQARVLWLAPLAALLLEAVLRAAAAGPPPAPRRFPLESGRTRR